MENVLAEAFPVIDMGVQTGTFLEDVLAGLRKPQKEVPSKYFYDRRGSALFDEITELDEYYPTRTELAIMAEHMDEMVSVVGPQAMIVEYGSGSSLKTRLLLDNLVAPVAYVPIDISRGYLLDTASSLAESYPSIEVLPVVADYTHDLELPRPSRVPRRVVGYFPGSTIGNFDHDAARGFVSGVARAVGAGGGFLIGVDLRKDPVILERAYNDANGVTAEFNLNVLRRMNRELGADFDLHRFEHVAFWSEDKGRIEMHLRSAVDQVVHVGGAAFRFEEGETIHTENCHKFTVEEFGDLVRPWFDQSQVWVDDEGLFSVQYLG
jgi:dimethylhistidine N-methyltransferase